MKLHRATLGVASMLWACAPSIETDETLATSTATVALFAPDAASPCDSVLPFPSDLAKNTTTGRLDLPFCPEDGAQAIALKTGLRTLDGYSLSTPIYTRFNRALDPASLAGAVFLFEVAAPPVPVAFTPVFAANDGTLDPGDDNTLYLVPSAPLAESTQYLAVVTSGVRDLDGNPVISDRAYSIAKSTEPLVDAGRHSRFGALDDASANALERLRQGFAPVFTALEAAGMPRDSVAVAWAFTTQTVHATLPALAAFVGATPATVVQETAILASQHALLSSLGLGGHLGCVYAGRATFTSLLTAGGTFGVGAGGLPASGPVVVDYLLTVPQGSTCDDASPWSGDKVAVFAHGLGRCKNDALALADNLAEAGWATLSFDGPRAGDRMLTASGDDDGDGCADQPATPELIALPGENPNPFVLRDHLREWALELVQAAAAAEADALAFAGITPTGAPPATEVALVGHSFGGMAAVLAASVAPDLDVVAVNAASADLGGMLDPLLRAGIADPAAAQEAVATFRWVLEPADPRYAAPAVTISKLAQVVSNSPAAEAPLHATATQTLLAEALAQPAGTTVFTLAPGGTSICDDAQAAVGALLKPCAAAAFDANGDPVPTHPATLATVGMRRQLVTFLSTAGAVLCSPAATVACP